MAAGHHQQNHPLELAERAAPYDAICAEIVALVHDLVHSDLEQGGNAQ